MTKEIIMCAPLPLPNGGITNWYHIVEQEAEKNNYTLINLNTSPGTAKRERSILYRICIQGAKMLRLKNQAKRIIRKNPHIQVAHVATSGNLAFIRDALLLSLFKKNGIKTVYHIHFGRIPQIANQQNWEDKLMRKALKNADVVIAIDPNTHQVLSNTYPVKRVVYLPNPVPKIEIDANSESKTVLFMGSVCSAKGIEELLSAWSEVYKTHSDWKLKIVGGYEQAYKKYLDNAFSQNGVEFTGYIQHDRAIKILAQSSFLVLPSYTEGFPNVVIEAMMCQKPVVATDVGAISDILSDKCGIVIAPKNVEELKKGIEMLISDETLRNNMGSRGRNKALAQYASDIIFEKYTKIWG